MCFHWTNIPHITLPDSITSIGNYCFSGSLNMLKSINLSSGLTSIGDNIFSGCYFLTNIHIPSSIKSIGNECFVNCSELETINFPDSITSIGYSCCENCYNLQSIKLPSSLEILEDNTFSSCYSLTNIILPSFLILIGDNCFLNCHYLTAIILPNSLIQLGRNCFKYCNIKDIKIPDSIQLIGIDCFSYCHVLTNFQLESNDNNFNFKVSYNDWLFYDQFGITCKNIVLTYTDVENYINEMNQQNNSKEIIIPNGVIKIESSIFENQNKFRSIIIPTTITSIGNYCFYNALTLTSLSIPNNVQSIGIGCFNFLNNLKQLQLPLKNNKYPWKVTYSDYLFLKKFDIECAHVPILDTNDYYNMKEKIPTEIPLILNIEAETRRKSISDNIISLKSNHLTRNITAIKIPINTTKLCNECFKNFIQLKSIEIPSEILKIGKHFIDGCISLTEIHYNGNWDNIVVSYDDHLRYKSKGLTFNSIEYTNNDSKIYGNVIPAIVKKLHSSYYTNEFKTIHIPNHITSLDKNMFNRYNSKLKEIKIPTSITTIPKKCFENCKLLTKIDLPSTLKKIQKEAFKKLFSVKKHKNTNFGNKNRYKLISKLQIN